MKSIAYLCILLLIPLIASAHPMGNFSINHYSGLTPETSGLQIDYIIDMAEIPAFQEMPVLDLDGDKQISEFEARNFAAAKGKEFEQKLRVVFNGEALPVEIQKSTMKIVPGAAGLPTFVMRFTFFAKWKNLQGQNAVEYRDENFLERLGWKEIVLRENSSLSIHSDGVSYADRSNQLTQYPADPTISPPQEITASFQISPDANLSQWSASETKKAVASAGAAASRDDRFTKLISTTTLTGRVLVLSLLIAFALGSLHAMSPGHGKTIVAGYLIGSRGTALHAVFLGAVVTLTHTIGVFVLGLITLYGSRYILPERLYPWLGFLSGVSIVIIGCTMFRKRLRAIRQSHNHHPTNDHHDHSAGDSHSHNHSHTDDHHHDHSHLPVNPNTGTITWRNLLTVGISGGALPCPSALVVLLSAISLHRIGFGLMLIVAFSLGLAMVLTGLGLLLVYAAQFAGRIPTSSPILARMPLFSSLIISVLGFVIAIQAILQTA